MDKINFCLSVLIAVAWIWGFNYTFKDGEIFGGIGNWMRKHSPEWLNKPTFDCPYCMSSIHGSLMFIFLVDGHWTLLVLFCFCCCGVTAIFDNK